MIICFLNDEAPLPLPFQSYQRSKVDGYACSKRVYERWPAASFSVAVVQRQAAEVAIQLQCHRVPAAIIDLTARDTHHARTDAVSTGATSKVTCKLEPQLPLCQLLACTHVDAQLNQGHYHHTKPQCDGMCAHLEDHAGFRFCEHDDSLALQGPDS